MQCRYTRLAGFLFLWLIITGLAGALTISHIAMAGLEWLDFAVYGYFASDIGQQFIAEIKF